MCIKQSCFYETVNFVNKYISTLRFKKKDMVPLTAIMLILQFGILSRDLYRYINRYAQIG